MRNLLLKRQKTICWQSHTDRQSLKRTSVSHLFRLSGSSASELFSSYSSLHVVKKEGSGEFLRVHSPSYIQDYVLTKEPGEILRIFLHIIIKITDHLVEILHVQMYPCMIHNITFCRDTSARSPRRPTSINHILCEIAHVELFHRYCTCRQYIHNLFYLLNFTGTMKCLLQRPNNRPRQTKKRQTYKTGLLDNHEVIVYIAIPMYSSDVTQMEDRQ